MRRVCARTQAKEQKEQMEKAEADFAQHQVTRVCVRARARVHPVTRTATSIAVD